MAGNKQQTINRLIAQLQDKNHWQTRHTAAQELEKLGPQAEAALDELWERIKQDDDRDVANAAWEALKAIQKGSGEDWLTDAGRLQALLEAKTWEVRERAAKSLQALGPDAIAAVEALWERIKQGDYDDVAEAAWEALKAIQKGSGEDWLTDAGRLQELLGVETWQVRARAAKSLQALGPDAQAAAEALWERIKHDGDPDVAGAAWDAVEAIDKDRFSNPKQLQALLSAEAWQVRERAAKSLQALGPNAKAALQALWETVRQDQDAVAGAAWDAVKAIQKGSGEDWFADTKKLKALLEAENAFARKGVAQALAKLAEDNLQKLGTEPEQRRLKERLFEMSYLDDDAEVRRSAEEAAAAIDVELPPSFYSDNLKRKLIPRLDPENYSDWQTRQTAAQALGELGREKKIGKREDAEAALNKLWERIKENDYSEVVEAAWKAVKAIQEGTGEGWSAVAGSLKELLALDDEEKCQVRKMAAQALGELGREKRIGKGEEANAAAEALWERIKKPDDPDVVEAAWKAVKAIQEGSGEDWLADAGKLKELLQVDNKEIKERAAKSLQDLGPQAQAAAEALWARIKQDDDDDVAMTAWDALKAVQKGTGEDWLADAGKLEELLDAKVGEVQERAAETAIQALVQQLAYVDADIRKEAARKLGDFGPAAKKVVDESYALDALWQRMLDALWKRISEDDDPDVVVAAWEALKAIPKDVEEDWLADAGKLKELLDAKSPEARQRAAKGLGQWLLRAKKKNASQMESLLERLWARVVPGDPDKDVRLAAAAAIASASRKEDLGRLVGVGEKIDLGQWLVASDPAGLKDKMWCADPQATVLIVLTVFEDREQQDEQDRALWQEARRQAARWLVDRAKQLEADYSGDGKPKGDAHYEWLWLVRRLQQLRRKNCELDVQHSLTEALSALWPVFTKDLIEALKIFKPDQPHQDLRFDGLINQMLEYCRAEKPSGHRRWRRSKNGQATAHSAKDASDLQNAREASDASDPQKTLERIAQLGFVESPDFVRVLVEHWVDWIADRDKPHLVETTAEAMRYNPEVIAHLLGQYDKDLEENKERFPQILFDTLQESFPGAFRYIQAQNGGRNSARNERIKELLEWLDSRRYMPEEYTQLLAQLKQELRGSDITKEAEILVKRMVDLLVRTRLKYREKVVRQRIAKQLALMSDRTRFERQQEDVYGAVADELQKHAVSQLGARLRREEDIETRRSMARTLAHLSGRGVGGRDAVEALAEAVVGEERQQQRRQQMLNDYYLKPSRERSDEAAEILKGAVGEAKKTLGLVQKLSSLVVVVGTIVLLGGLFFSFAGGDNVAQRVAGALAGLGGFAGVIAFLIKDPLNRIQNAVSNLVQLEAAFTSFIWELNLNSTYIQSQYVKKGELSDTDIARTVQRIEDAMSLAISLVQRYTREGEQRITRINSLSPTSDQAGKQVIIYGQYLNGDSPQQPSGLAQLSPQASQTKNGYSHKIFVNHKPIAIAKTPYWTENAVHFELPTQLPDLVGDEGVIWLSLSVDGMETNALPFLVVKNQDGQNGAEGS